MLIDWFTVVAQIVNFLVLVALLKRFLWGRLVAAIDNREKRVAGQLAEAESKNQDAGRQMDQARALTEQIEKRRPAMLIEAKREADEQRKEMVQQARQEVQRIEAKWREDLEREQAAFLDELRRRSATEMLAVIRRALADLACADIQHCATEVFLEKLRTLDAAALRDLAAKELVVLTADELGEESQRRVRDTLERQLGPLLQLKFERTQSFAWGIELRGKGRRIGWNSDTYIESLEENLREALEHRAEVLVG
jgi:F-type H+-transporting ATPase subunit b